MSVFVRQRTPSCGWRRVTDVTADKIGSAMLKRHEKMFLGAWLCMSNVTF